MTAGIVATSLVVWPAAPFFLFMHGKDITIPKGTEITAFVNGDMRLLPSRFGVVPVPAAQAAGNGAPAQTQPSAASPAEAAQSTVAFRASPDGADISVDGKYVGSTPSTISLKAGDHVATLEKAGYAVWQRTLTVAPGASLTVNATLGKRP